MLMFALLTTTLLVTLGHTARATGDNRKSPFGFWYNGVDKNNLIPPELLRTQITEETPLHNHLENMIGQWKRTDVKKRPIFDSIEEEVAFMEMFNQILAELVQARMQEKDMFKMPDDLMKLMERTRYKRRDNMNTF